MKVKELITKIKDYEDFEIEGIFLDRTHNGLNYKKYKNIEVGDIGHSSKIVLLTGEEQG